MVASSRVASSNASRSHHAETTIATSTPSAVRIASTTAVPWKAADGPAVPMPSRNREDRSTGLGMVRMGRVSSSSPPRTAKATMPSSHSRGDPATAWPAAPTAERQPRPAPVRMPGITGTGPAPAMSAGPTRGRRRPRRARPNARSSSRASSLGRIVALRTGSQRIAVMSSSGRSHGCASSVGGGMRRRMSWRPSSWSMRPARAPARTGPIDSRGGPLGGPAAGAASRALTTPCRVLRPEVGEPPAVVEDARCGQPDQDLPRIRRSSR